MKPPPLVSLKDVSFQYSKTPLLNHVSFSIAPHDFLGIVGPNGGGKTTLLKLIMGLHKPTAGSITLFGTTPEKGRYHVGYLAQTKDLDRDFPITVEEIVLLAFVDGLFSYPTQAKKNKAHHALERLGITQLKQRKINELSGGEKQRVFMARAIANKPKLLLLDEPIANIDISMQKEFFTLLAELNRDMAIVVVDHNVELLSHYCKEIACVNKCHTNSVGYHDLAGKNLRLLNDHRE